MLTHGGLRGGTLLVALFLLLAACTSPTTNRPNPFSFPTEDEAEPGVPVTSDEVTIAGLTSPLTASVTEPGTLYLNGSPVGNSTQVQNGSRLAVEVVSSAELGESVTVTVTVGGFEADFTVRTREAVPLELAANVTEATPGQPITLSWTLGGTFDSLELTSSAGLTLDVTGDSSVDVTAPTGVPSVTYTLTGSGSGPTASDSLDVEIPLWVCENPADVITFRSPQLAEFFRELDGVPSTGDFTCAHALAVTEWTLPTWEDEPGAVDSLVGLQHFVNLEYFWAEFNEISDLSPLSGLSALEVLQLDGNRVTDLTPIAGLTSLRLLGFWDNGPVRIGEAGEGDGVDEYCRDGISDISPLAGLVNVEILYLSCNNVSDLSAVGNMESLQLAFVIGNRITSIAPLEGLTSLRALRFSDNLVASDEGVLGSLTGLRWLEMAYNRLGDDSLLGLGLLGDLFAVDLEGNFFSDLSPILGNVSLPGAEGTGDGQEPDVATVSLGYNCFVDPEAVGAALVTQGFAVVGINEPGAQQRPPEDCDLGPAASTYGSELSQQRLQLYRQRTGMR